MTTCTCGGAGTPAEVEACPRHGYDARTRQTERRLIVAYLRRTAIMTKAGAVYGSPWADQVIRGAHLEGAPRPPTGPVPAACPCGEECEVVDYPTGVRSCGNVWP